MNHQVFERTWHSSEYACFSVVTPSPRREPCGGPWASWGSVARALYWKRAAEHSPTSPEACKLPESLAPTPVHGPPSRGGRCLRVLPRASASRRWRAAADRGTARCGRRARKPEQGPGRFNNPRVRSPPASFATAPAKRRAGARARRPGREGAPRGAPLLPNPTQLRTLT